MLGTGAGAIKNCQRRCLSEVGGVKFEVVGEVNHLGFKIPQSACIDHTDPDPELRPLSKIIHLR